MQRPLLFYFVVLSLFITIFLSCTEPNNPFLDPKNVSLKIEVPEKENGYLWSVGDKVTFLLTLTLPSLIEKVVADYDDGGKKEEKKIDETSNEIKTVSFVKRFDKKGERDVEFIVYFKDNGQEFNKKYPINIGVLPTILNDGKVKVTGELKLGNSISLSIEHEECESPEYQWFKNSTEISQGIFSHYSIAKLQQSDSGGYHCMVSSDWGVDTSKVLTISLEELIDTPTISIHPIDKHVTEGQTTLFTVVAEGQALSYSWQKNEKDIANATLFTYTTEPAQLGGDATYRCLVSNTAGTVISKSAQLTVHKNELPPEIVKQPEGQEVEAGSKAMFMVTAKGTNLQYQWFINGKEINMAVSEILLIEPVSISDNGKSIHCVVSNAEGSVVSENALLKVKNVEKPTITLQPQSITVTLGSPATFSLIAKGKNLKYQWLENGSDINNATEPTYTLSQTTKADDGKSFQCKVSNPGGEVLSDKALLAVTEGVVKPKITQHPQDVETTEGSDILFSIIASGIDITFQWQKNNIALPGANKTKYTYVKVKKEDNGAKFRCIVTNSQGSDTSNEGTLKVVENIEPPKIIKHPQDITVPKGEGATFTVEATGTNLQYQWKRDNKDISGATTTNFVISPTQESDNKAIFTCLVSNNADKIESNPAKLTVHWLPKITKQPENVEAKAGESVPFTIEVTEGNPSATRFEWKDNSGTTVSTSKDFSYTAKKEDGQKSFYCMVSNDVGKVESNKAILTVYYVEITKQPQSPGDVVLGSGFSLSIEAKGNPSPQYEWQKDGSKVGASQTYSVSQASNQHKGTYTCKVYNNKGCSIQSNSVTIAVKDQPPKITKHPQNKTVTLSSPSGSKPVTFAVEATGTNLRYNWDGISGTSPSVTGTVRKNSNGARISCTVSNSAGSVTSNSAEVTVYWPPTSPSMNSQSQQVIEGQSANFSVSVSDWGNPRGNGSWFKDNSTHSEKGLSIRFNSARLSDAGVYKYVIRYGQNQSVSSSSVRLSVEKKNSPPYFVNNLSFDDSEIQAGGGETQGKCNAEDADGNQLSWSVSVNNQSHFLIQPQSGSGKFISFNVVATSVAQNQTYTFTVTVSDGKESTTTRCPLKVNKEK